MVDLLFTPSFSEEGSNARQREEQAIVFWRDYLQDCGDGEAQATLEDVLIFSTGANSPPPIGFDEEPKIAFTEEKYPKANTCVHLLYLPTIHNSFEDFKETIDFAILNSPTFEHA
ncbi:G2/M phase-specific E3 ubiquitin-protein ligase-like [Dendronephthya gigantea]|uniref:G2/M phase-specific E3 ubiquitin-protein ligase-like n=1 Tax=Dendronephthya gigantea TaxID=151771 RepID=UPI00106B0380|nr:G2/M phase-specific E3 ubiquitin-protein ligase-like [Dendronephthya gigantea]